MSPLSQQENAQNLEGLPALWQSLLLSSLQNDLHSESTQRVHFPPKVRLASAQLELAESATFLLPFIIQHMRNPPCNYQCSWSWPSSHGWPGWQQKERCKILSLFLLL